MFDSFDMIRIPQEVVQQASELEGPHRRGPHREACQWSVCWPYLTTTRFLWSRLGAADRAMPILTRTDLTEQRLPGALRRVLGGGRPRPLSESQQKRARAVVNPEIVLPRSRAESLPLFQEPEIPMEDVIRVMDREQERVAEHLGAGYRVLRGVAGSGKTLVLAHRARHLHKHWSGWRILVLCFNRVLANALRTMVDARQAAGSHQHRPTCLPPSREKGRPLRIRPTCRVRRRTGASRRRL